jgi:hypothetical protein
MNRLFPILLALSTAGCGYHVAGHANLMPKEIHVIAIPAFINSSVNTKLARSLAADITREFIARTKYTIVADADGADAVLNGVVLNFGAYPTVIDPVSQRATAATVAVSLQLTLVDRHTGKAIFSRPAFEYRDRYEISTDPQSYFDESGTAIDRVSRQVARSVVSAILENF